MKTAIVSFLVPISLFLFSTAIGQQYEVTYSAAPYESLVDANLVNEEDPNMAAGVPLYLNIPIGFDFLFLGQTYSELAIAENGYVIFSVGGVLVSFISFLDSDLKDFQSNPEESPIYYSTEGESGNRIFKCEMVKVGFEEDLEDDDYANAQLWIYENCNEFEIHIGESTIDPIEDDLFWDGNPSPFFAYGDYNPSEVYLLAGDPIDPFLQVNPLMTLSEMPANGTVYTFSDCEVSIEEKEATEITCFPNPATNVLNVTLSGASDVRVLTMDGALVFSHQASQKSLAIDVSSFSSGMYVLQVVSGQRIQSEKFFKF
jgi:hypothetical protein